MATGDIVSGAPVVELGATSRTIGLSTMNSNG